MDDPKIQITDADLARLLAEADEEDRLLVAAPAERPAEPREALDSQILGGLVSP
jgi:hypothetical protein